MAKPKTFEYRHFKAAADRIGCEPAVIEAVIEQEGCNNDPFFRAGGQRKLKILFERHIFWRQLEKAGLDPREIIRQDKRNAEILAQSGFKRYGRYTKQYDRREKAQRINEQCAMESCSYSGFQILGYHWKALGYDSVHHFVEKMDESVDNHIDAFVTFIEINDLAKHLINKDFESFARKYNGPAYYKKGYHISLSRIYQRIIARDLPRHPSAAKAILKSSTLRRGAALAGSTGLPAGGLLIGTGQVESMIEQVKAARETLVLLSNNADGLAAGLSWLPWAISGNAILIIALLGLIIRRYLLDRGYLQQ